MVKGLFFATNRVSHQLLFGAKVGKNAAHSAIKNVNQPIEKRFVKSERPSIADRGSQDAPQNVSPSLIAWLDTIGDRKAQSPDVIGDHPESHVSGELGV